MTSGAKYRIDTNVASDSIDSRLIKLNNFEKYISIVLISFHYLDLFKSNCKNMFF